MRRCEIDKGVMQCVIAGFLISTVSDLGGERCFANRIPNCKTLRMEAKLENVSVDGDVVHLKGADAWPIQITLPSLFRAAVGDVLQLSVGRSAPPASPTLSGWSLMTFLMGSLYKGPQKPVSN